MEIFKTRVRLRLLWKQQKGSIKSSCCWEKEGGQKCCQRGAAPQGSTNPSQSWGRKPEDTQGAEPCCAAPPPLSRLVAAGRTGGSLVEQPASATASMPDTQASPGCVHTSKGSFRTMLSVSITCDRGSNFSHHHLIYET